MPHGAVAGVVLAAGGGRRFGRPKALVEVAGVPLVTRAVTTLAEGGCHPVLVVVGAAAAEVRRIAVGAGAEPVDNPHWRSGLGTSVRAGLAAADGALSPAALLLPVDQPIVTPALVARLVGRWHEGATVVVATFDGQGRTPVLLDRSVWGEAAAQAVGDVGARHFVRSRADLAVLVPCDDVGAVCDVDTEADLRAIEQRYHDWLVGGAPPPADATRPAHGDPPGIRLPTMPPAPPPA